MRKILFIMTLILPLLISNGSWGSSLPECEGSPLNETNWQDSFEWDNCQGTITYPNDDQYVGEFKDGSYNDQGTMTYPDGDQYVGEWKDDMKHGQGTYTFPDGAQYVGEWKDGFMSGQGTYTFANGDQYVGEWKDD
ncbi:MAG: hypothetical protein P8K09_01790, partial [Hyphomicrobiales bacterium]|nr:hypothetical protein [Hyphomicrobiales bacterium]